MKRGTVVWVDLSDTSPPEMGKVRPGVVVSGTAHNDVLNTVVVVPTSSVPPEILPLRVAVGSFAGKQSYAV
ncbi:MAG TPA: type II toxin-antitoxin system PemK/MazF family toxin, partial [Vicinamibacterales bacterium]